MYESLVLAFEDGRLGTIARQVKEPGRPLREAFYMAFGYNPTAAARNMALSYRHLGRAADGKLRFDQCIEELGSWFELLDDPGKRALAEAEALFEGS